VRVTTIDNNVTCLKVWLELSNEVIDSRSSLDKKNNLAGKLQLGAELLHRVGALNVCT